MVDEKIIQRNNDAIGDLEHRRIASRATDFCSLVFFFFKYYFFSEKRNTSAVSATFYIEPTNFV